MLFRVMVAVRQVANMLFELVLVHTGFAARELPKLPQSKVCSRCGAAGRVRIFWDSPPGGLA